MSELSDRLGDWVVTQNKTQSPARALRTAHPTNTSSRDNEWLCAGAMIVFALFLAYPGDSMVGPNYTLMHRIPWMTEAMWSALFGGVGLMRVAALYINGKSPRTPVFRYVGSLFGFLAFSQLAVVIAASSLKSVGTVAPGIAFLLALASSELVSLRRASYDVRYLRRK